MDDDVKERLRILLDDLHRKNMREWIKMARQRKGGRYICPFPTYRVERTTGKCEAIIRNICLSHLDTYEVCKLIFEDEYNEYKKKKPQCCPCNMLRVMDVADRAEKILNEIEGKIMNDLKKFPMLIKLTGQEFMDTGGGRFQLSDTPKKKFHKDLLEKFKKAELALKSMNIPENEDLWDWYMNNRLNFPGEVYSPIEEAMQILIEEIDFEEYGIIT